MSLFWHNEWWLVLIFCGGEKKINFKYDSLRSDPLMEKNLFVFGGVFYPLEYIETDDDDDDDDNNDEEEKTQTPKCG